MNSVASRKVNSRPALNVHTHIHAFNTSFYTYRKTHTRHNGN